MELWAMGQAAKAADAFTGRPKISARLARVFGIVAHQPHAMTFMCTGRATLWTLRI